MMSWIDLHKFANVIFEITQKLLYITSSNLVRSDITNKETFLNLFHGLKRIEPVFLKEFLACNGCFGLFHKIRKGSGTNFWSTFSAWFSHKNVPYLILYQWTKFQCHTLFLSQNIKQNVLSSSYLSSWWHHKFYDFSWINLEGKSWKGKKEGKKKIQKFEHLEYEKSFFDKIKNIFHSFFQLRFLCRSHKFITIYTNFLVEHINCLKIFLKKCVL